MESGHGVRASFASTRYSNDELSVASDHEADGSLYTASFAASEPFDQTHSSFAFDDDASASFSIHPEQHNLSRSLEVEDSLEQEQEPGPAAAPGPRQPGLGSRASSRSAREPAGTAAAAAEHAESQPASGRQSEAGTVNRSNSRASSIQHHSSSRAERARASVDSVPMRTSTDSLRLRSSAESLPAVQHSASLQAELMPARPSSSSPIKRPSSSCTRRHHHHQHSSSAGQHGSASGAAQGPAAAAVVQPVERKPQRQPVSRSRSGGNAGRKQLPEAKQQQQQQLQQQQSASQPRVQKHQNLAEFEGDLSEWGRTNLEDFYDEDDQSVSSSQPTLSSGISPRDTRPRVKPFDMEAARETLAYNAGMYSRAQVLRREGTAPAAMGVADDLPTRMAYQQLNILAGMAGKVQDAILHNKRIFEQRLMQQDRSLLKRVFEGWRGARYGSVAKQAKLRRAAGRIMRGQLSRAFFAWKEELHLVDKNLAMKRKVSATIGRGLLKRSFLAWQRLAEERWWKNQLVMREREVALLEGKIRGYEKRPIQVLQKRRMRALLAEWYGAAAARRDRRRAMVRAGRFWANQQLSKAWKSWVDDVEVAARRRVLSQKVVARCQKIGLVAAWNTWMEVVEATHAHASKLTRAAKHWQQSLASRAWRSWADRAGEIKARRKIAARWMQPAKARAFAGWLDYVLWQQRSRLVVGRALAKLRHGMLATAFVSWLDAVQSSKTEAKLTTKEGMQEMLAKLQAENERLRRDNERFVRLIDSGEWGRGRVAELVSAGEVMQGERDALLKLIASLRREYEAVQMAKGAQEDELRLLKDKMTVGGPARNRLLVKGGSSFNALVRAMKQDLVDNGTAAKDPALLYEIDKLSMDRVQVYPDGELNVQAVASAGTSAAFARPVMRASGRGTPSSGSPMHARGAASAYTSSSHSSSPSHMRAAAALGSSSVGPRGSYSQSAAAAAAGLPPGTEGLYSTLSVEAGGPAGSTGSPAQQGSAAMSTQRVLQALSSLTPAQVDQLEAVVKSNATAAGAAVGGTAGTAAAGSSAALRSSGRRGGV